MSLKYTVNHYDCGDCFVVLYIEPQECGSQYKFF